MPALRLALFITLLAAAKPAFATTLLLQDGRVVHGELDPRTDQQNIWLRTGGAKVVVATAFPRHTVTQIIDSHSEPVVLLHEARPNVAFPIRRTSKPNRRIRSIEIDASIANWDSDSDDDGIRLHIFPLDSRGTMIPVGGTLRATLTTWSTTRKFNPSKPVHLESWVRSIPSGTASPDYGVVVELPFKELVSADQRRLLGDAVIDIRYGVQGQGVFHARRAITLHRFSPVDDQLLLRRRRHHQATDRRDYLRRSSPRLLFPVR